MKTMKTNWKAKILTVSLVCFCVLIANSVMASDDQAQKEAKTIEPCLSLIQTDIDFEIEEDEIEIEAWMSNIQPAYYNYMEEEIEIESWMSEIHSSISDNNEKLAAEPRMSSPSAW